jgi:hypothetical protein
VIFLGKEVEATTIQIHNFTREKLEKYRKYPTESWEDIILRILDCFEKVFTSIKEFERREKSG